jgi:hypothetical protein
MAAFLGQFSRDPSKPDNKGMKKYNEYLGIHLVRPHEAYIRYTVPDVDGNPVVHG